MYRSAIKVLFPVAIISIVILSCGEKVDTPSDGEKYASLIMEYDCMADRNIAYPYVTINVINAFEDVGLSTEIRPDQDDLPTYADYDPTWEYDYFPDSDSKLRTYAKDHDNNDLPWHLLSVDKFEVNEGGGTSFGVSAWLNRGNHLPPTPANERYSMIFGKDIIDYFTFWNETETIPAALVTTVVHELGHQRAGLTCSNTWAHTEECVMSGESGFSLAPRFCRTIEDTVWQTTHCLENIEANYGNF